VTTPQIYSGPQWDTTRDIEAKPVDARQLDAALAGLLLSLDGDVAPDAGPTDNDPPSVA
jgi:hypothetical protein